MPVAALVFIGYAIFIAIRANKKKQRTLKFPPRF